MVENLLQDVEDFGFVPNGGRAYYTNRTQPPFLALMVADVARATANASFAAAALPLLEQEMLFWATQRSCSDATAASSSSSSSSSDEHMLGRLSRFFSEQDTPRPESFAEDVATAGGDAGNPSPLGIFAQLAAGAETGWDYSSRWIAGPCDKTTEAEPCSSSSSSGGAWPLSALRTNSVVPTDLNAVLYRAELAVAWLHELAARAVAKEIEKEHELKERRKGRVEGGPGAHNHDHGVEAWLKVDERSLLDQQSDQVLLAGEKAAHFLVLAKRRREAMERLMWEPSRGLWSDLVLVDEASPSSFSSPTTFTTSNVTAVSSWAAPLFAGLGRGLSPDAGERVLDALEKESGLLQAGGALTTTVTDSGQQWDSPNAWAPLQIMLVHGLGEGLTKFTSKASSGTSSTSSENGGEDKEGEAVEARARALANSLADSWLESNWLGFQASGMMYEKYDAYVPGQYGGGGEYVPQSGFGWTNGAALELLERQHGKGNDVPFTPRQM